MELSLRGKDDQGNALLMDWQPSTVEYDRDVSAEAEKARAARRLHRLQRQASSPRADFELWYADGVRFDLLPATRSMLRRRGGRLRLPTPGTNVRVGVVGAIRYPNKHFLFAHQPRTVTGALVLPLLQQLVAATAGISRAASGVTLSPRCFTPASAQGLMRGGAAAGRGARGPCSR